MILEYLIQIILTAASYYLFSNEFFKFIAEIKSEKVSFAVRCLAFSVVYSWFVIASLLKMPLIINWFIFLIILIVEVRLAFKFNFLIAYALSMFCIIMSLAVNVFFRSNAYILLNSPIKILDKEMASPKTFPIFFGFVVMTVLFYSLRHFKFSSMLERMLNNKKSLAFYAWTETYIYLFLLIQLLAFNKSVDEIGIMLWGVKASLFSIIILIISIIYSLRVASLHYYMDKKHETRNFLIQEEKDINKLWKLAFTDMLTGCGNRQLLDRRLEEYAGYGGSITIAFIDLNGLKKINDQYGHLEGDNCIINVSQILLKVIDGYNIDMFRYGGDEFIIISNILKEDEIIKLLAKANEFLGSDKQEYYKSISYGVVRGDCADYKNMLIAADSKMYEHKLKYYEDIVRT